MSGPENADCNFLSDGTVVSGCEGIDVSKVHTTESGYCKTYGYGYGCTLEFSLSINSALFDVGTYKTTLVTNASGKEIEQKGSDIMISPPLNKGCSVRANSGTITADDLTFTKNKINFFLPPKAQGQGYITGQDGKGVFLYKFMIGNILVNTPDTLKVEVNGKFKIGQGKYTDESGVITFDKANNITSYTGTNVEISGMKVYFRKFC
jgi:hypothetical protein